MYTERRQPESKKALFRAVSVTLIAMTVWAYLWLFYDILFTK